MAPLAILRRTSMHHVVEELAQCDRSFTHLARSNISMINATDRTDLNTGSGKEHLVGKINFGAVDGPLDNLPVQLVAHELDDGSTCDAFQHVIGYRRCWPLPLAINQEIFPLSFPKNNPFCGHDYPLQPPPIC